ncbi:MAG: Glycosyltransferase [uncultured bacterium]|nr:MAG: Glycosyltransferase [uncultured bacterium]
MKVVFIGQKGIPSLAGGVERHVEELAVRLAKEPVTDVVVYTRPWYTAKKLAEHNGVRLVSLPSLHSKHLDAISHTFIAVLHAAFIERPDIIHIHAVGPALLTGLARVLRPKAKVVVTFHCIDRQHQKWSKPAKLMLWLGEWMAMKFAHEVITVSKNLKQYAYEVYGRTTTHIPNGVAEMTLQSASIIEQQFGLQANTYILMVSRLVRHKGAHHLIKAYEQLTTNKKLVIVGNSAFTEDYEAEIKVLAKDNPNIIFTGLQTGKTLAELYSNAYLFVLPSESEGLPLVLLEAGAYGKALLASDIPANLEIVEAAGLSFENTNVEDLKLKLEELLQNPEAVKLLGKQARQVVLTHYHWNDITKKTVELYRDLLMCYTPQCVQIPDQISHPIR